MVQYEKMDVIYYDNTYPHYMFFINEGQIKIFSENDFPFAVYRAGSTFGDVEILL